jgi:hypothetical protein
MWKAFDEMEALGWIGKNRPRMFAGASRRLRTDRSRIPGWRKKLPRNFPMRIQSLPACAVPKAIVIF